MALEMLVNAVSDKSDVYSYGMTLLELVGSRRNFEEASSADDAGSSVPDLARDFFPCVVREKMARGELMEAVDASMADVDEEAVELVIKVALCCIQRRRDLRPSMLAGCCGYARRAGRCSSPVGEPSVVCCGFPGATFHFTHPRSVTISASMGRGVSPCLQSTRDVSTQEQSDETMAASMLRSAAASAFRHRPSSVLHLGRAAASSTASSPPATTAIAASARRHLSTANNPCAPEEEQRKRAEMAQVEAAKAELLRQMMVEDATADRDKITAEKRARTEKLADFLGRQFGLAATPAADVDKNLLLALLVRSSRMEQEMDKLRSSTARTEQEMKKLRSEVDKLNEEIIG
ncbi:unnamed protein product [Urochloa humidicola]